jgi:hypothetical protein
MKQATAAMTFLAWLFSVVITTEAFAAQAQKAKQRFVDNGDGTISDLNTGLMWEKKTGVVGHPQVCYGQPGEITGCDDLHNVNNQYLWTLNSGLPDGSLFTNFLARINQELSKSSDGVTVSVAGYTDWRVPNVKELMSIVDTTVDGCGPPPFSAACIDQIFGPTYPSDHWTSTYDSSQERPGNAWKVLFNVGAVISVGRDSNFGFARAVRGGR